MIYNHMHEMIPVRISDSEGESCIVVTGLPDDYLPVRATGLACEGLDSIFYMSEDGEDSEIIYQVGNGIRYCLTDEQINGMGRLSMRPCTEEMENQVFTADEDSGRLVSVEAVEEDRPKQCVASDIDGYSVATGRLGVLHVEECTEHYRPHMDMVPQPLAEEAIPEDPEERLIEEESV